MEQESNSGKPNSGKNNKLPKPLGLMREFEPPLPDTTRDKRLLRPEGDGSRTAKRVGDPDPDNPYDDDSVVDPSGVNPYDDSEQQ